ncbi:MAG: hypothetical protein ABIR17_04500 [Pseudolysinimonas sp.]|uniref:hypothetical protein n=1 Tax=Pseudolysinimonas sp. TaxID=2680009 RepID=UPI00326544D9
MPYNVVVTPEPQRKTHLQDLAQSPSTTFISWEVNPGTATQLPVVSVHHSLPLYRMTNGRTRSTQMEFVADNDLPVDFFSNGQENQNAQQKQHEILAEFAVVGRESSVTPIMEVLKLNGQREPILVTPSGVVLNGNRRLAAMRELYETDPAAYSNFSNIDVAVLPLLTPEQSLEVEVRLQMTPQTLLEYSWVDQALVIEEALAQGRTPREVAALNNESTQWVNSTIRALDEARRYLRDWIANPTAFNLVKNKKQFFLDVAKRVKDKSVLDSEASRRVAWSLETSEDRSGRIYNYNAVIGDDPSLIVERVAEVLGGFEPGADDPEPFEVDFGAIAPGADLQGFIDAADSAGTREVVQAAIQDAADDLVDKKKNAERAAKPLKIIRSARSNLEGLQVLLAPVDDLPQVVAQLSELIIRAGVLRDAAQARLDGLSR